MSNRLNLPIFIHEVKKQLIGNNVVALVPMSSGNHNPGQSRRSYVSAQESCCLTCVTIGENKLIVGNIMVE